MKNLSCVVLLFYGFVAACWIINLVKLCCCDFAAPWKDEALHLVGLLPFVSIVTAWL